MAVISFKCPNCDGELIFDPATGKYKCEYCMSSFSQKELDKQQNAEDTKEEASEKKSEQEAGLGAGEAKMYHCPSCGAEIVTDATTAASFCYYCHNPVILSGRLSGEFLPDKIIPFEIPKEKAVQKFLDHVGRKKFVPKAFFDKKQIESITGVYFPYWNYNAKLDGGLQGTARKIRTWTSGDIRYTETKHFHIRREGNVSLSNMTENALQKANAKLAAGVMPYRFDKMKDFNMGYLSGFLAEKRDIEKNALEQKVHQEARECADKMLRDTVKNYSTVSVENINFRFKKESWVYCLLPVWTITYKGNDGNIYYYSMNGQTGEVCGELPVDRKKLKMVSGIVSAVVLALGLLGGYMI